MSENTNHNTTTVQMYKNNAWQDTENWWQRNSIKNSSNSL